MPYSPSAEPLTRLADGTVKQISPFTGTEVWTCLLYTSDAADE